jgi:hypothetical protein
MNWSKIIVFFIFFSHINTLFSQKNNIIPTPIEQTINSGYMEIENSPEIIADFELNSAATLFKNAVKKLGFANDKKTKNRILIMPGSGISKKNLKNFELFKEIHGSFKDKINSNGFKLC